MTILISGMIAADPWQGGATWAVLQYVLGFRRLGHEVYLVEPISPKAIRPAGVNLVNSDNAVYFRRVMEQFGLSDRSALLLSDSRQTVGLSYPQLRHVAQNATILMNLSGMLVDPMLTEPIPARVYLDLDPAFNQLWSAVQGVDMRFGGHTHFLTIGQAIGEPHCPVPTCGLDWLKTWQPIVLDCWPVARRIGWDALTTVGNWRAYGSIEYQGLRFGQKVHSLRPFYPVPSLTSEKFSLALAIYPEEKEDLAALENYGWRLLDPALVANTPNRYQEFIQGSKAEFGIAKSGYVVSQCGWFSDRSLCYLASGRPVLAQETGFSRYLPTGEGLFSFRNGDDVIQGIESLRASYPKHSARARAIAQEFFDSDKVLSQLLIKLGV